MTVAYRRNTFRMQDVAQRKHTRTHTRTLCEIDEGKESDRDRAVAPAGDSLRNKYGK